VTSRLLLDHPVPLEELPTTRITRHRLRATATLVAAAVVFALVMATLSASTWPTLGAGISAYLAGAGVVGFVLLLRGLVAWTERRTVTIDATRVESVRTTCFGTSAWNEPLTAYRGVLRREILVPDRNRQGLATVVHEVRLVHDSEAQSVTLYATRDAEAAREYQGGACRQLGQRALAVGLDGFVDAESSPARAAASVTLDAGAGDSSDPRPLAPALRLDRIPGELRVEPRRDGVAVTIERCEMAWVSLPMIIGFPVALLWISGSTSMPGLMRGLLAVFALAIAVVLVGVFVLDRIGRRRIEVRGDRVEYFVHTPFGDLLRNRIDLQDLLGATVRRDGHGRPELAIESREHAVEIGGGLPMETLEWLRALLIQNARRTNVDVAAAVS
jgi:hypothetical protein